MIQIKDYAAQKHVSYEAVRKQIKRYDADLEGHIIQRGRTQFLDDVAVAFLDEKRKSNPVIVYEHDKDIQIEALQNENADLKTALAEAEHKRAETLEALSREKDLRIEQSQQMLALEQKSEAERQKLDLIVEASQRMEGLLQRAEEERKSLTQQLEVQEKERQQLVQQLEELENRGFWARLFNKKKKKAEE